MAKIPDIDKIPKVNNRGGSEPRTSLSSQIQPSRRPFISVSQSRSDEEGHVTWIKVPIKRRKIGELEMIRIFAMDLTREFASAIAIVSWSWVLNLPHRQL